MSQGNGLFDTVIRRFIFPLFIIITTLNLTTIFPYISLKYKNDIAAAFRIGIFKLLRESWRPVNLFDYQIWLLILYTFVMGIISIIYFPGKKRTGPRTQSGFQPIYRDTGFVFYLVNMIISITVISKFDMSNVFLKIISFAGILTVLGFTISVIVFLKGIFAPSPGVFKRTNSWIWDFYCGIELYPRIGQYLDLKQLINCRFGMWLWQLVILISWKAHHDFYKLAYLEPNAPPFNYRLTANVLLQTIYICKFFWWEIGYMQTIDIVMDHFGYMIQWGCFAWVPTFYTMSTWSATRTWPVNDYYDSTWFYLNVFFGVLAIYLNYAADAQRQIVRATDGQCKIWFQKPKLIYANYTDEDGVKHRSLLLASGFWAFSRHCNYVFELLAAFLWCYATSNNGFMSYAYFLFLIILLVHRSLRDEEKCRQKYGKFWDQYCEQVKYKILYLIY